MEEKEEQSGRIISSSAKVYKQRLLPSSKSKKYATTHSVREKGVQEGAWVVVRVVDRSKERK